MVGVVDAPLPIPVAVPERPPTAEWLSGENPAVNASIARYLSAGEDMAGFMDVGWKICAVLFVLVAATWALGILPGAYRLF
jgi:hypothetical protein